MRYLVLLACTVAAVACSRVKAQEASSDRHEFRIVASNAHTIRLVTGEPTSSVQGVPASPVHSFVPDGDPQGIEPLTNARAMLDIDPVTNEGRIDVRWTDASGRWKYVQRAFVAPDHPTGLRVGPSSEETVLVTDDPVTTHVYLHGDTTAGGPVLPTLFNILATWGPADVQLNGQPFENPFDGPVPQWNGHTMLTVGAREPDGTVRTTEGDIFDPAAPGNGTVDFDDLEFHLVFHDAPGPMVPESFPPAFSFFYHLQFEDVKMYIRHEE